MTDKETNLLLTYLAGGSLLGAGAGAVTSLVRRSRKDAIDTPKAPGTVYVDENGEVKSAGVFTEGVGLGAGTLGAAGAYALTTNFFRQLEKKRLQEELEDAQEEHLKQLAKPPVKEASDGTVGGHTPLGWAGNIAVASPFVLAAISGVLANKALERYFPEGQANVEPEPDADIRRIVRTKKVATMSPESVEHLIRLGMEAEDRIGGIGITNAVKCAAHGNVHGMRKAAAKGLFFEYCDSLAPKLSIPDEHKKQAAIVWLSMEDTPAALLKVASASAILAAFPTSVALYKEASDEDQVEALTALNSAAHKRQYAEKLASFHEKAVKQAGDGLDMGEMLGDALAEDKVNEDEQSAGSDFNGTDAEDSDESPDRQNQNPLTHGKPTVLTEISKETQGKQHP